jgi:hypothetical protein
VTATRDRRSDPETAVGLAWYDRPIIGQFRGLPWWAAVLLAFGLTAIAAFVDMQRQDSLGRIYQGAFVVGCVVAVCFVRRRSLFGPIVQPPLVFAVTAIAAVTLLSQKSSGGGLKSLILSVALPLTSNFPTMGITTAIVVAIGAFRLWRERDPNPDVRPNKAPRGRATRGADVGLADEPGQGTGGRGLRERVEQERVTPPPRRGRPDVDDAAPDERAGGRLPGRGPRTPRDAVSRDGGRDASRETGREARRRDAASRSERGRADTPPDAARGRGRGGESPRRREPGAEGGVPPGDRGSAGRRGADRDAGRDGRGSGSGSQPRRRPPESRPPESHR